MAKAWKAKVQAEGLAKAIEERVAEAEMKLIEALATKAQEIKEADIEAYEERENSVWDRYDVGRQVPH